MGKYFARVFHLQLAVKRIKYELVPENLANLQQ